jgi:hypothetical protein
MSLVVFTCVVVAGEFEPRAGDILRFFADVERLLTGKNVFIDG